MRARYSAGILGQCFSPVRLSEASSSSQCSAPAPGPSWHQRSSWPGPAPGRCGATNMEPFKPSAFTPFLRRFTDERARDLSELRALYRDVRKLHYASPYCQEDTLYAIGRDLYGRYAERFPDDAVLGPLAELI